MAQTIKKHRNGAKLFKLTESINKMNKYASEHFREIPLKKIKTFEIDLLGEIL